MATPTTAASSDPSALFADWPPPYLLEGDSWCFLGLCRAKAIRQSLPGSRPLSLLGWAPVVLQATRYASARSERGGRVVSYSEVSLSAIDASPGWPLLPVALLVDEPLATDLGLAYGFPKALADVRVRADGWRLVALADGGRTLTAARGLGALLLTPLRWALARRRVDVRLPLSRARTAFQFRAVRRVAPAVGMVSPSLADWACGAGVLPLGVAVQGFAFTLEEPRAEDGTSAGG